MTSRNVLLHGRNAVGQMKKSTTNRNKSMSFFFLHSFILAMLLAHAAARSASTTPSTSTIASRQAPTNYEIVGERQVYSRWRTVIQRQVRYPRGNIVDFDVSKDVLLLAFCKKLLFHLSSPTSRHLANDARRTLNLCVDSRPKGGWRCNHLRLG